MQYQAFVSRVRDVLEPGRQFPNPGGGFSVIQSLVRQQHQDYLYYVRGRSTIQLSLRDLHDAFLAFRGKTCETADLRRFRPHVFDSVAMGHTSNCTLFFHVLREAGLAGEVLGTGVPGNRFRTTIG
jgi:hypothetical protein